MMYTSHILLFLVGYFIGKKYGSYLPLDSKAESVWTSIKVVLSAIGVVLVRFGLDEETLPFEEFLSLGDKMLGLGIEMWGIALQLIAVVMSIWNTVKNFFSGTVAAMALFMFVSVAMSAQEQKQFDLVDQFEYQEYKKTGVKALSLNDYKTASFVDFISGTASDILGSFISLPKARYEKYEKELDFWKEEYSKLFERHKKYEDFVFEIARMKVSE